MLVLRFSSVEVNQYCQSKVRTSCGGACGKGLSANNSSTSLSFASRRTTVFGTVFAPRSQRGEPQVPIGAGLIRSVDSGPLVQFLWLITKMIRFPVLAVVGALEFDLIPAACHHGKQPVAICNPKWLHRLDGRRRQPIIAQHLCRSRIKDPRKHHSTDSESYCLPNPTKPLMGYFYRDFTDHFFACPIAAKGSEVVVGRPQHLFHASTPGIGLSFDVSLNGKRLLVNHADEEMQAPLHLVTNWPAALRTSGRIIVRLSVRVLDAHCA